FDFENDADLKAWSQFLPDNLKVPGAKEPPVKIELSGENAASGKKCLKVTFAGGKFPAIETRSPLEDWTAYKSFGADVTASRTCLVAFRVVREDDKEHRGWVKLALLHKGRNAVVDVAPPLKGPTQFEIIMYAPHDGETLYVDDIRVSTEVPATATPPHGEHVKPGDKVRFYPRLGKIPVLGLDIEVANAAELAKRMTDPWVPPQDKTVKQVEAEFSALYDRLKKEHPRAVMAIFRNGQRGFDPAAPEKEYAGWESTGISAHGPNAVLLESLHSIAGAEQMEVTFRGRPAMMRVDFSSIPQGSQVLAARLLLVRSSPLAKEWNARRHPFVAEFCNRPWKETEVNTFEYAKDRFWKETHGSNWDSDDPDFLPIFAAYGPSQGTANVWDFTEAVKWWTDGKHPNYGFTLYNGDYTAVDYLWVHSRWVKDVSRRPAMMVIYEPKK
ncbi:MAG: DNRLRE domain-containing protein, partial [Thermoguttaceae bacterium]